MFSIVNQQVRLAGTPRYRLGIHVYRTGGDVLFSRQHTFDTPGGTRKNSTTTKPTKTGPSEVDLENVQSITKDQLKDSNKVELENYMKHSRPKSMDSGPDMGGVAADGDGVGGVGRGVGDSPGGPLK
jgi:hypothetical protein